MALLSPEFLPSELLSKGCTSALVISSAQVKDFSPLCSEEDTEISWSWTEPLTLSVRCGGCTYTGGLFGSAILSGGAFDLVAKAISATDRSELELSFCGAAVSGYMDCLLPAEISATSLSTPRPMTTHNFVPSSGFASVVGSSRMTEYSRHVVAIPSFCQ